MSVTRGSSVLIGTCGWIALLAITACGARSTLLPGEPGYEEDQPPPPECVNDAECGGSDDRCAPMLCQEGRCVRRITVCASDNPCEIAACDPATGACVRSPSTFDLDGDGHLGALPGTIPGTPEACGDDCDDTSAAAYPGGVEICDGVDNDCNGVIDDGAGYAPPTGGPSDVRVSSNAVSNARAVAIAHDGARYFANYTAKDDKDRLFGRILQQDGTPVTDEARLSQAQSDTFGESVVWTGDRYGVTWENRRDGNYEVYFATFDRNGNKRAPGDIRVSDSPGFSINGDLLWTGSEFLAVWQDGEGGRASFGLFGRRISLDGELLGDIVPMVVDGESPQIAAGRPGLGVVYTSRVEGADHVYFQPFDFTLRSLGNAVQLTAEPGQYPSIAWNDDRFVVLWDRDRPPFQIHGTTIGGLGEDALAPLALANTTGNARFGSILSLGDRLILIYSDDRDDNQGYELYTQTLERNLRRRGNATRITKHPGRSGGNLSILGPEGDIGVLFTDQRNGDAQTYFTRLVCRPDGNN